VKKIITAALLAAVAMPAVVVPTAASAQSNRELRRDRQDIREEQRELRDARRRGDRSDIRDDREARQEYREDLQDRNRRWGDNDWRDYRTRNRGVYARGNWRAPFGYTRFRTGVRIAPSYWGPRYVIGDPWRYRLPPAGRFQRWVRHYNDVLLIDMRRGVVVRVIPGFFW